MESLYFLIPLSVVVCIVGVAVFFWAVNNGQYDDLDAEGEKILFDDETDFELPTDENNMKTSESRQSSTEDQSNAEKQYEPDKLHEPEKP